MHVLDVPFFLRAKDYAAQEQVKWLKIDLTRLKYDAASVTNSLSHLDDSTLWEQIFLRANVNNNSMYVCISLNDKCYFY